MDAILDLVYAVSAHRPDHTLFIGGRPLPLEARIGGIFGGFLMATCYLAILGRWRSALFPAVPLAVVLVSFVVALAADGLNALLFDLGVFHLYRPTNPVRFATGLLGGLALAAFVLPSVASGMWKEPDLEPSLQWGGELLGAVMLLALYWLLAVADFAWAYYPVALSLVFGVVLAFGLANVYVISLPRRCLAETWRRAAVLLGVGLMLAIPELLLLRWLRELWLG